MHTMIVSFIGRKGGIGKTTNAVTLAAAGARAGLRVLLVDADGQGNVALTVGLKRADAFKALILDDAEFQDVIRPAPVAFAGAPLAVISAGNAQRLVEVDKSTPMRIVQRFQELRGVYDLVVIDTSPGITEVHAGVYFACDYVLLPTMTEYSAMDGVRQTHGYLENAARMGAKAGVPVAEQLGIVINRWDSSARIQQQNYGWLRGKYGDEVVRGTIREMTVWQQCAQQHRSIYEWQPGDDPYARRRARVALREFESAVWAPVAQVMEV